MNKVFDNIFFTSSDIKRVHRTNISYYKKNKKWQVVSITPNFEFDYETILDKNKKILISGDWRRNAKWYRFLKSRNYKVYLEKKTKDKK